MCITPVLFNGLQENCIADTRPKEHGKYQNMIVKIYRKCLLVCVWISWPCGDNMDIKWLDPFHKLNRE